MCPIVWFLAGRTQYVKIGNIESDSTQVNAGAPQGTVSGPNDFKLMINDLTFDTGYIKYGWPVGSSPVDSSQVDSTRSIHHVDGSSHGQFNTGRFIPECDKWSGSARVALQTSVTGI